MLYLNLILDPVFWDYVVLWDMNSLQEVLTTAISHNQRPMLMATGELQCSIGNIHFVMVIK